MLASPAKRPPVGPGWAFEFKWDGVRAIARWDARQLTLHSRLGNDITPRYPELHLAGSVLGNRSVILDGEIIAIDAVGRPSFSLLQNRMHVAGADRVRTLMRMIPCVYMIFDVLWLDGVSTMALSYAERRTLLASLELTEQAWQTPEYQVDGGEQLLGAAKKLGLEGIVAKRLDRPYEPGRRSSSWVKVRIDLRQEFVVGGWTPGRGNRQGEIGALLVGTYDGDALKLAGKVGTGFDRAEATRLMRLLRPLTRETSPFADPIPWREARFITPEVVVEVKFTEWTGDGKLRHPSYQGQRTDKSPRAVVRET